MGTSQRDSLPYRDWVADVIEETFEGGEGGGQVVIGPQNCLLDGLQGIFRDEYLDQLEEIVYRCLTQSFEVLSDGKKQPKSRVALIEIFFDELKDYVREGLENDLRQVLKRCLGPKVKRKNMIPGDGCERILFVLYEEGRLWPALVDDAALAYLYELGRLYFEVRQSTSLGTALDRLYQIKALEDEPALQILEKFSTTLISMKPTARKASSTKAGSTKTISTEPISWLPNGTYQESALRAANKTLEMLLGEPASLPFASADEIRYFISKKNLVDLMETYYARYLCLIMDYHFSQVAPKRLTPQEGLAWSEGNQQADGHCTKTCAHKASILISTLEQISEQTTRRGIQDLDSLTPEKIKLLFERGEERLRLVLFPGSVKVALEAGR